MRFAYLAFLLICFGMSASASSPQVQELRETIKQRDFARADALLGMAQEAFLKGDLSAEDIRELYRPFITSSPDSVAFVDDWHDQDPENPRAQVALAWSLFNGSVEIGQARNYYSRDVAREMRGVAWDLFTSAYMADNALIPASDAAVRGYMRRGFGIPTARVALMRTLRTHPNWGSVKRHVAATRFRNEFEGREFCSSISSQFSIHQGDTMERRCLIQMGSDGNFMGLNVYIDETFWDDNDPETTLFRLHHLLSSLERKPLTAKQVAWAKEVILNQPFNQYDLDDLPRMVQFLDAVIMGMDEVPAQNLVAEFRKARLPEVEAFLVHDPFNTDLIGLAQGVAFEDDWIYTKEVIEPNRVRRNTTRVEVDRTAEEENAREAAHEAQRQDFALRRLRASPYDPNHWFAYGSQLRQSHPIDIFAGDTAMQNAIVFADDPTQYLQIFLNYKREDYFGNRSLLETDLSKVQADYLEGFTKRHTFARETDIFDKIVCPYARAKRLYELICAEYPSGASSCDMTEVPSYEYTEELEELAETAPACAAIREADIVDLWYETTPFDRIAAQTQ